jgi:hypothetical protein
VAHCGGKGKRRELKEIATLHNRAKYSSSRFTPSGDLVIGRSGDRDRVIENLNGALANQKRWKMFRLPWFSRC